MSDPVKGLAEMRRVTRRGGLVAACVWDHAGGTGPLSPFWEAARTLDPDAPDESRLPGTREGELGRAVRRRGATEVVQADLAVSVEHATFEEWWEPFTLGVGPAGSYVAGLDEERVAALRERCRESLPEPQFVVTARAWAARGRA